jgi:hypothetical protein
MLRPRVRLSILKNFPARLDEIAREKALESNKIEIWFQTRLVLARRTKSPAAGQSAAPARALPLISCRCNSPSLKRPDLTPRRETRSAPIRKRILPTASCAWQICQPARSIASAATNTCCGGKHDRLCLRWSRCAAASERRAAQPFHSRSGDASPAPCPKSSGDHPRSQRRARRSPRKRALSVQLRLGQKFVGERRRSQLAKLDGAAAARMAILLFIWGNFALDTIIYVFYIFSVEWRLT